MQKKHYTVPRTHGQRTVAGGPMESVTVHEPVCNHSGLQVNGTTDEALVTCTRCQHYLTHGRPRHRESTTLGLQPYSVLLQYLDDAPLENCTAPTFYEFVEASSVPAAIANAKALCCQRAGYGEIDEDYEASYGGLEPLLVIEGHHTDLCPSPAALGTKDEESETNNQSDHLTLGDVLVSTTRARQGETP